MKFKNLILIITSTFYVWSCKPQPAATQSGFDEDLKGYRVKVQPVDFDKLIVPMELPKTQPSKPTHTKPNIKEQDLAHSKRVNSSMDSLNNLISGKNASIRYTQGYRIVLYSGTKRDEANEIFKQALSSGKAKRVNLEYEQPNYRVKAGHYFNRLDANDAYLALKNDFPLASILPDRIEIFREDFIVNE